MVLNLEQMRVEKLTEQLDCILEQMLFQQQGLSQSPMGIQLEQELNCIMQNLQELGFDLESLYN